MRAPALAFAGVIAAALLAVLWLRQPDRAAIEGVASRLDTPVIQAPAPERAAIESAPAVATPAAAQPTVPVASEIEIFERIDEKSYAEGGGTFVDHLVKRGLARSDAERIVRESIRESTACLRDALRLEAEAQAVDYDTVLYALESTFGEGDGPFLWTVIDIAAVQVRAAPCVLTVTQRAGISPSFFQEIARPAER